MAEIFLRRTLSGWLCADKASEELSKRFKVGEAYKADVKRARNYKNHCQFMALLDLTYQNQDRYTDFLMFRRAVALAAGHVEQVITLDGEPVLIPRSYSYDELPDESDFLQEFGAAMKVCAEMLHGMDLDELAAEVGRFARERVAA